MDPTKMNEFHKEAGHYASLCISEARRLIAEQFDTTASNDPSLVLPFAAEMMKYTFSKVNSSDDGLSKIADTIYELDKTMREK